MNSIATWWNSQEIFLWNELNILAEYDTLIQHLNTLLQNWNKIDIKEYIETNIIPFLNTLLKNPACNTTKQIERIHAIIDFFTQQQHIIFNRGFIILLWQDTTLPLNHSEYITSPIRETVKNII